MELADLAGLSLDDWQQFCIRCGMRQRGLQWSASRAGVWVPRQNGKGGIIEARVLAGLFLIREPLIIWSAHQYNTAHEGFLRIRGLIEQTPELHRQVRRYWTGTAWQGIELRSGQRLRFLARSKSSGRGFTGRCIVLDEAQDLTTAQMAAMLPTISAQRDAQVWFLGTPPINPEAWVYGLRKDGEAGAQRLAWMDWGAPDEVMDDPKAWTDRDMWYATNPALGIRIAESTVEDELGSSGLGDEFPHERLGVWRPGIGDGSKVIPADVWQAQARLSADRPPDVAFALVVSRDRTRSAIGWAGRFGDGLLVGLSDWRPGTSWVIDRLLELRQRWNPVGLVVSTRSENLLLDLEKAGVTAPQDADAPQRGDLAVPTAAEDASAYGLFVDSARSGRLWHLDDTPVNVALAQSQTRPAAGGATWDDRKAEVSPLRAVTLAAWLFESWAHLVADDYDPVGQIF